MNSFKDLVGKRVQIVAKIDKYVKESFSNVDRVILHDVYVNGVYFRDHVWTKKSKWFQGVDKNSIISATARLVEYRGEKDSKLGLKSFRNIQQISIKH